MFIPKKVNIITKDVEVSTGSYNKLKQMLEGFHDERVEDNILFINMIFNKTNKVTKENIKKLFTENYNLFNYQNNFGRKCVVHVNVIGDFEYDFSKHEATREEIKVKVEKVNKEYEKLNQSLLNQSQQPKKKLKVNTMHANPLNISLDSLLEAAIKYDGYLFEDNNYLKRTDLDLDVDFQRDLVWTLEQKQRLIWSLINNLPIGNFYVNRFNIYEGVQETDTITIQERSKLDNVLYDGKQRISAILEFMYGKFSIVVNNEEYFYGNLEPDIQRRIINKVVNVYHTSITDKNKLIDFYITLNKNQTAHKEEDFKKALKFKK